MLLIPALLFVLVLAALIDIITRQDWQVKHLPKLVWVLLVVFLPLIGSMLWFIIGREYSSGTENISFGDPRRREAGYGSAAGSSRPRSTEEELAALEREIAFHEKQAEIDRLEAKLNERKLPRTSRNDNG